MDSKVKQYIKPELAIARIFAAIIYADGFLSQQELEYWETILRPKYHLPTPDFRQVNSCTFAQAVQIVLSPSGRKWLEECKQTTQSLIDDMECLANCDRRITPKESLICLCTRLSIERQGCTIISNEEEHLRLSKTDIIYVEQSIDESINKEICEQYETIKYVLHNFGFNFVYVPKVQEAFLRYSDSYRKHLLQFLFPEDKRQEELDTMIVTRLPSATTAGFSNLFMESVEPIKEIAPSLLFKLPTNSDLNPSGRKDFAVLEIKDSILQTIQVFFKKYDALTGRNYVQVQNGEEMNMFLYRGFHKTFIEYLRNVVTDIQINLGLKKEVRFGSLGELPLSKRLLAAYMTMLYLSVNNKPFCKDWKRLDEQYSVFRKIYSAFQPYNEDEKDDFYMSMQVDYGKIIQKFGNLPNKSLQNLSPIYDRSTQIIHFRLLPPVQVVTHSQAGVRKIMSLTDWVDSLPG